MPVPDKISHFIKKQFENTNKVLKIPKDHVTYSKPTKSHRRLSIAQEE